MSYSNLTKEDLISKVEKLEQERDEFRDKPELTFEQAAIGIAHVSGKGEIIRVNEKFAQLFGYDTHTMTNMNVNDITHPGETNIDASEVQKVFQGELDYLTIEKKYVRKDDSNFFGSLTISLAKQSFNESNYFIAVLQDISERKYTQQLLRKSEEKYSAVVENSNDGILIHKEGKIVFVNRVIEKELGYKVHQVIGKNITDFIAPEFHKIVKEKSNSRLSGEAVPEITQIDLIRKDTSLLPVELSTSLIEYEDGIAVLVFIRNISERKNSEKNLLESEFKLKEAQEISKVGHWGLDLINNKLEWSDEIYRIFGIKPQGFEATYEAFLENIHPDDRDAVNKAYNNSLETKKPYEIVHRLKLKDDTIKYVIEKCESMFDSNGNPIRSIGTVQDITKQVENENALKESEERLSTILENSPDPSFITNEKGEYVYVNKAAIVLLGYTKEELLCKTIADITPKGKKEEYLKDYKKLLGRGQLFVEFDLIKKDGTTFPSEIHAVTLPNGLVHASCRDISKRKSAEEALKNYQNHLEDLVKAGNEELITFKTFTDASTEGFGMADLNGQILYQNNALNSLLDEDFTPVGTSFLKYSSAEKKLYFEEIKQQLIETGQWKGEIEIITQKGKIIDTYQNFFLIKDEKGNPAKIAAIVNDITERKKADKELIIFKKFADTSSEGFGMADLNNKITYMNKGLNDMYGFDKAPINKSFLKLYPKKDLKFFKEKVIPEVQKTGQWQGVLNLLTAQGKKIPAHQNYFMINDENGQPYRIAAVITDISKIKKVEEELRIAKEIAESANRAKSTFLANMSHELRTPLNAILGFAQISGRDKTLSEKHLKNLEIINRSGVYLLSMINQVLDLAKVEAGKIELVEEPMDLLWLIEEINSLFRVKVEEKGLRFELHKADGLPRYIITDGIKLRQVLINLLGNAIKFSERGKISLSVTFERLLDSNKKNQFQLQFKIEDTGIGMKSEEVKVIFEAFVQAGRGQISKEGTGLGLAISQKFVTLMNGEIKVKSKPGVGSTFYFDIPVIEVEKEKVGIKQKHKVVLGVAKGQVKKKILVVDDVEDNRNLVNDLLLSLKTPDGGKSSLEIKSAKNGKEAVDICENWSPHLIFMDMRMPLMDGYEASRIIRSTKNGKETPIIALTASVFKEDHAKVYSAGCNDLVRKPFHDYEIFEMLDKYLRIEFIYQTEEAVLSLKTEAKKIICPANEILTELLKSAKRHDYQAIEKTLKDIVKEDSSLFSFVQNIRQLADDYQMDEIVKLIEINIQE